MERMSTIKRRLMAKKNSLKRVASELYYMNWSPYDNYFGATEQSSTPKNEEQLMKITKEDFDLLAPFQSAEGFEADDEFATMKAWEVSMRNDDGRLERLLSSNVDFLKEMGFDSIEDFKATKDYVKKGGAIDDYYPGMK